MQQPTKSFGRGLQILAAMAVLGFAGAAPGLQFGRANVASGLNEPLTASLTISALTAQQMKEFQVRLAPKRVYQRFDLERSLTVGRIELTSTLQKDAGRAVVQMRTRQPIQQALVSVVLEAKTRDGRYLHRYDLLINPTPSTSAAGLSSPTVRSFKSSGKTASVVPAAPERTTHQTNSDTPTLKSRKFCRSERSAPLTIKMAGVRLKALKQRSRIYSDASSQAENVGQRRSKRFTRLVRAIINEFRQPQA